MTQYKHIVHVVSDSWGHSETSPCSLGMFAGRIEAHFPAGLGMHFCNGSHPLH